MIDLHHGSCSRTGVKPCMKIAADGGDLLEHGFEKLAMIIILWYVQIWRFHVGHLISIHIAS